MLELVIFLCLCSLTGIVVGLIGGMLGMGGGVIIVPVLLTLYSQQAGLDNITNLAVATSLGAIVFTSLSASYAQIKRRAVNWGIVRIWTLPVMAGSLSAGHLAAILPEYYLRGFIAVFLTGMAINMLINYRPKSTRQLPGIFPCALIAGTAGLSSGLAGIGGGNIVTPVLLYFNQPFVRAVAVASTLGVPIALAGTSGFIWAGWEHTWLPPYSLGYVHLPAVFAIAVTSTAMAPIGVALAHRAPVLVLRRFFACMLLIAGGRLAWLAVTAAGLM